MEYSNKSFTLNKEFNLNPQQLDQAYSFQNRVKQMFQVSDVNYTRLNKYTNINTTTRFLQSQNFSFDSALTKWSNWLNWSQKHKIDQIQASECLQSLQEGNMYWHGENIRGYPCLILRTSSKQKQQASKEDLKNFFLYMLEKGCKLMDDRGVNKACIIWDKESGYWGDDSTDLKESECKEMAAELVQYYEDRLDQIYILRVNWFLKMLGSMAKSFMPQHYVQKLTLYGEPSELLQEFKSEQLEKRFGGSSNFEYKFDPDTFNKEGNDDKSF